MADTCSETWWTGFGSESFEDRIITFFSSFSEVEPPGAFLAEGGSTSESSIRVRLSQIDASNGMSSKEHLPKTILRRRSQCYRVAAKSFADPEDMVAKPDPTMPLNLADHVVRAIFQRRQGLGKASPADLISAGGHRHRQRLVRPQMVIDRAPLVQALLQGIQIRKGRALRTSAFSVR